MRTKLDCIPCIMNQALRAGRAALNVSGIEEREHTLRAIMNRVAMLVPGMDLSKTPPEVASEVYEIVSKLTGVKDPYERVKMNHIDKALEIYPKLKEIVQSSEDKLLMALKIAIIGNAIDLGSLADEIEVLEVFNELFRGKWMLDEEALKLFREVLESAERVLYIADNAGETVFDRPLFELIAETGKKIKYAVRSYSIVNDATREDAIRSGFPEEVIIETGSKYAGVLLEDCSQKFRRAFRNADLIIAKGQGNFETLSHERGPIFFLLKAKCRPVATALNVPIGSLVFKASPNFTKREVPMNTLS